MNEINNTKTMTVLIDDCGLTAEFCPYLFPTVLSGMIAGAFRGYYKADAYRSLASQIDNIINGKGCNMKWLRTVSDIVDIAKVVCADEDVADPDATTVNEFLTWVRDGLNGKDEI